MEKTAKHQNILRLLEEGFVIRRIDGRCGDGFVDVSALEDLIAEKEVKVFTKSSFAFIKALPKPKKPVQRPHGTSVTREEFLKAHTTVDDRTGIKKKVSSKRSFNIERKDNKVHWTCPNCTNRNHHKDMGRDVYVCSNCQEGYDLK